MDMYIYFMQEIIFLYVLKMQKGKKQKQGLFAIKQI